MLTPQRRFILTERVEKKAVSLYPDQWAIVESLAQNTAKATGGPPNLSLALRRIVTVYARRLAQPGRTLVDPPDANGYQIGAETDDDGPELPEPVPA
jgi:hypothetical protein